MSHLPPELKDLLHQEAQRQGMSLSELLQPDVEQAPNSQALATFLDLTAEMMCIITLADYTLSYQNNAFARILGHDAATIQRELLHTLLHPDDLQPVRAQLAALSPAQRHSRFSARVKHIDGSYHAMLWHGAYLQAGQVMATVQLRPADMLDLETRTILESISEALFVLDGQWRFTYLNNHAERLLMWKQADLLGRVLWEAFPEAVDSQFYLEYNKARSEQTAVHFEAFYPPLDTWFEVSAYPTGEGLSVYFRDINTRKHMESKMEAWNQELENHIMERTELLMHTIKQLESEMQQRHQAETVRNRLEDLIRTVPDFIWTIDTQLRVHYMNPHASTQLMKPEGQPHPEQLSDFMRAKDIDLLRDFGLQAARTHGTWKTECCLYNHNGREITTTVVIVAHMDEDHLPEDYYSIIAHDISNERALFQRERQFNELKTGFIEIAAHEFRTPMTIIQSSADILRRYGDRIDPAEPLERIYKSLRRMENVLDEGLELIRSESDQRQPEYKTVNVEALAKELIDNQLSLYPGRRISLTISPDSKTVRIQEWVFHLALDNLVQNALKYTEGAVRVQIRPAPDKKMLIIQVDDSGPGMTPTEQRLIFEPFYRGTSSEQTNGTGLGLAILYRAVVNNGGIINVASSPEVGTQFRVSLPIDGSPAS